MVCVPGCFRTSCVPSVYRQRSFLKVTGLVTSGPQLGWSVACAHSRGHIFHPGPDLVGEVGEVGVVGDCPYCRSPLWAGSAVRSIPTGGRVRGGIPAGFGRRACAPVFRRPGWCGGDRLVLRLDVSIQAEHLSSGLRIGTGSISPPNGPGARRVPGLRAHPRRSGCHGPR